MLVYIDLLCYKMSYTESEGLFDGLDESEGIHEAAVNVGQRQPG